MTRSIIPAILFAALILSACGSAPEQTGEQNTPDTAAKTVKHVAGTLNLSGPVLIDSTENVMYPLVNTAGDDDGSFLRKDGPTNYWNIIFYNINTQKRHLLDSARKMIINSYNTSAVSEYSDETNVSSSLGVTTTDKYIFYDIIINDFNNNGQLDSDDPGYLFVSDKDGYNFKQISPNNLHVRNWELIAKSGKILMQTYSDTNHDKKFTDENIAVPYIYDLKKGGSPTKVFDQDFINKVNKLHQQTWPVKKK